MLKFIQKIFNKNFKYNNFIINNNAVIIALEAETKRRLKCFDEALSLINKAIEIESNNDMYYVTKSLIFYDTNKFDESLKEINKAIKINNKVERYKELQTQIKEKLSN